MQYPTDPSIPSQVDARDQCFALLSYLLISLLFLAYVAHMFAKPIMARHNPPQSVSYVEDTNTSELSTFPTVVCT